MIVLTCNAPFGVGGLGRLLADVAGTLRAGGRPFQVYAGGTGTDTNGTWPITSLVPRLPALLARIPPIRFNEGLQQYLDFERFDRMVARRLTLAPDVTMAFCGQALHTFDRARALGCTRLELIAPTSHLAHVWRQHARARARDPIAGDWLNRAHLERAVAEYDRADVIHVCSTYAWNTFINEGVPAGKLRRLSPTVDARFRPPASRSGDGIFRIVYTGALTVVKGVPLLLDVFARFDCPRAELTLVGATGSRGMRRLVEQRCAADPRLRIAPGDPLPHLQRADLYVHASYQDGFGYAVAEALACAVPAIVTEDTGAKELVTPGVNGAIVPTGDSEALLAAIQTHHREFERRQAALREGVPCAS